MSNLFVPLFAFLSFLVIFLTTTTNALALPSISTSCPDPAPFSTHAWHSHIVSNYLALWRGDLSLLNTTISPVITLHGDRFPSFPSKERAGTGSFQITANTSAEFEGFVKQSRVGFEQYGFNASYWLGEGERVAIRWFLDGVVGSGLGEKIPTTLKPGAHVTYNGTDSLVLNRCTGLVDEIDSAQDLISLFHNLGLEVLSI